MGKRDKTFQKFWRSLSPRDKKVFARRVDRSVGYLFLVAGGHRAASPMLALEIQRVSQHKRFDGFVAASSTRPEVFRGAA